MLPIWRLPPLKLHPSMDPRRKAQKEPTTPRSKPRLFTIGSCRKKTWQTATCKVLCAMFSIFCIKEKLGSVVTWFKSNPWNCWRAETEFSHSHWPFPTWLKSREKTRGFGWPFGVKHQHGHHRMAATMSLYPRYPSLPLKKWFLTFFGQSLQIYNVLIETWECKLWREVWCPHL